MGPRFTLQNALRRAKLNQYEAAQLCKISETRFSRICVGRVDPTDDEKKRIAAAVCLPVEALFEAPGGGR